MASRSDAALRATWALVALLVAVHVGAALSVPDTVDALFFDRSSALRIAVGGQHRGLVGQGQLWRLCTSVLLHNDALHLAFNCTAIGVLGRLVEPYIGGLRLTGAFVLGGVAGSVASQLVGVRMSDGASGGAFALLAVALWVGRRERGAMDPEDARLYGPVLAGFLVLNLVLSAVIPFIDAVGHLGGLAAGAALGAVLPIDRAPSTAEKALWGALLLAFALACAYGWVPR